MKSRKSLRTDSFRNEIRNRDLPNTKQKYQLLDRVRLDAFVVDHETTFQKKLNTTADMKASHSSPILGQPNPVYVLNSWSRKYMLIIWLQFFIAL
jgi:hypothetical protein